MKLGSQRRCPIWGAPVTPRPLSDPLAPFSSLVYLLPGQDSSCLGQRGQAEEGWLQTCTCASSEVPSRASQDAHSSLAAWSHHSATLTNKFDPWEVTLSPRSPGGCKNKSKPLLMLFINCGIKTGGKINELKLTLFPHCKNFASPDPSKNG